MGAPLTDIHFKNIVELGIKTILSNPDRYLNEIFGDAKLPAHAALYGAQTIESIKKWIKETRIPVVLGFDLSEAQMPAVTIHLAGSAPAGVYVGDDGIFESEELQVQERDILVPKFSPADAEWAADRSYVKIALPDSMPFEQKQLFLPGLLIRDESGREYLINLNENGEILVLQFSDQSPIGEINLSRLEVVSPIITARYNTGSMTFNETVNVVVHGHASRPEGLWLFYIVMWTLLRFRPVLTGTFGLDLSLPEASDYSKASEFLGENVWRRYITVQAKTNWSWSAARQREVLGVLLGVHVDRVTN